MYVHRIKSGSHNQYVKYLLRVGCRVGSKVKNRTLMNLSKLSQAQREQLKLALAWHKALKDTSLLFELAKEIISILGPQGFTFAITNELVHAKPARTGQATRST